MEVKEPSVKYLVAPGYKRTEVGVIPENWTTKSLSDLFIFRNGVNADKDSYGRGTRFVNVLESITYSHLYGPEIAGQVTLPEPVVTSYAVRKGDVLFNRTSETQEEVGLAATYLGTDRVVFGGFVIRGRPTDQSLDPDYSGYALRAPFIRSQIVPMGQGAIRANIGQHSLGRVVAPVPPLAEQRRIASALRDADALVESLEKLLAKKRHLKQGAMQELLTGKTRLPGFSETVFKNSEFGELPSDWDVLEIGQIAQVKTGPFGSSLHARDYVADGAPIITVEHLGERGITHTNLPMVSKADHKRLAAYRLEEGDIVFSRVGSVDRNARVTSSEVGWLFSGRLLRLRASPVTVDTKYLSYQFHSEPFKQRVRTVAVGQTMASLNTQILREVLVVLPPTPEQSAIAAILSDMDTEITALETKLTKARQLKQGMMQELLTGRIRLV